MTQEHLQELHSRTRRCNYPTVAELENEVLFGDLSRAELREVVLWYKENKPSVNSSLQGLQSNT